MIYNIYRDLKGQRLAAVAVLGWLLLTDPLLSLFQHPATALGIPVLYLYLFATWALLILVMALTVEFAGRVQPTEPEE